MRSSSTGVPRRLALFAAGALVGLSSCDTGGRVRQATTEPAVDRVPLRNESGSKKMKVTIGSQTFTATLDDNPSAAKLGAVLPPRFDTGAGRSTARRPPPTPPTPPRKSLIRRFPPIGRLG